MRHGLISLVSLVCLVGCTTVYENGRKVLCTGADIDRLHFRTPAGTELTGDKVSHSPIHRELGNNVVKTGTAVATSGLLGFLRALFP